MPTLKNKTFYFMLFLLSSVVQSQNTDTVTVDDTASSPSEMYTSVDISYSQDKGNTDFLSLYYGLNFTLVGDLGTLKDTEFLFDFMSCKQQSDVINASKIPSGISDPSFKRIEGFVIK